MMIGINSELLEMARAALKHHKQAFVPSDIIAQVYQNAMGQAAGSDSMQQAQQMPDSSAPGQAMPTTTPLPTPAPQPDLQATLQPLVQQAVDEALARSGAGNKPAARGAGKPDLNVLAHDIYQLKKLIFRLFQQMGWEIPADIIDGPNRNTSAASASSPAATAADSNSEKQSGFWGKEINPLPQTVQNRAAALALRFRKAKKQ
jgi:hypothetical protein